ncbi:GntR family transcriptional regulator [Paracidovorax avenae]|uniref:GntR family transcriptional regulator n=1 Tax=Paracidovorax avenae TaxID=80867 RepID=UPI000D16DCF0|nr:GntR family transcriptional regulator [Paracidovorax avenae]AVS89255.1 GntR family transcriptional regulator [Paracidovorax avenae]AVT03482.1 GntR family transcriptional regulator [Paracidovorax avenae]
MIDTLARIPSIRLERSRHAAPQIFEALRELIIAVELVPGTVLPRAEIAEHYGVSQTPVRDAMIKLGEEGLVEIYPQHATIVSQIDVESARQAHFLRRALEIEIVREIAARPREAVEPLLRKLRVHIASQRLAASPDSYADFIEADRAFHRELYEAAGAAGLWALVRQRSGHIDRLRRLHLPAEGKTERVIRDHSGIVAAIELGQPEAAAEAMRTHLAGTLGIVEEIRAQHPTYLTR